MRARRPPQLLLMGHRRIRITDVANQGPPLNLQVEHIDTPREAGNNPTVKAYANEILACIREIVKLNPMFREHVQYFVQTADLNDPWRLVRGRSLPLPHRPLCGRVSVCALAAVGAWVCVCLCP